MAISRTIPISIHTNRTHKNCHCKIRKKVLQRQIDKFISENCEKELKILWQLVELSQFPYILTEHIKIVIVKFARKS